MKVYESNNLKNVIENALSEYSEDNIKLAVYKCFKSSITHSGFISLNDIINETDFFRKCIVEDYQKLIKKVYNCRWSLDISQINIEDNSFLIIVKVIS